MIKELDFFQELYIIYLITVKKQKMWNLNSKLVIWKYIKKQ